MARKSRKNTPIAVAEPTDNLTTKAVLSLDKQAKPYQVGIYARLSFESEANKERDTVDTQIAYIREFVKEQDDMVEVQVYADISVTGTTFERPEFDRMIQDIRAGKINTVITRDLSRLGRNYVEAGNYIERVFPFLDVRYIAITDDFDTARPGTDLSVPLKNIVNEYYSKDLSKKVETGKHSIWAQGGFSEGTPPYGYYRATDGSRKLLIDEEVSDNVVRIFNMFLDGKGYAGIAKTLQNEGILSPPKYRFYKAGKSELAEKAREWHMLKVLEVILNKSYHKLGFQNGKGKTFEGLLTTSSISLAQKYYELLTRVKNGETPLKIDERIKQVLPDFPKFAITYSVTENEDGSQVNQEKMKQSLDDYNAMFDTKFDISQITSYNSNLNKRLSRKDPKYKSRNEQLDLVIVVDRLLTGFDAPCMSTIFIDRQPMGPHDLIQAFSRTNRIFDKKSKPYGQIVTFQAPVLFKKCVDDAVKLYSAGSTEDTPLIAEWDDVEPAFKKALAALRIAAQTPDDIPSMSDDEKLHFMKMFQSFDRLFAQLKSFSRYDESMLDDYGITEQEYIDYAGHYLNIKSEIGPDPGPDPVNPPVEPEIDSDYELMAYSNTRIDYEYIINLIQNIVNPEEDGDITPEEKQKKIDEAKQYVEDLRKDNPKVADIMSHLINEIELDESRFKGKSILNIVENMKHECIEQVVSNFCLLWHADKDDVMYAATHYRNGVIPNESAIKASINYPEYKNTVEHALPKFKYYAKFFAELRSTLDDEIKPLV